MSGWSEISRDVLVDTPHLRVFREKVATPTRPDGIEWMVARRKQAAIIAPRTPEGSFLLVRQERIPIHRELWEFPAGQVDGGATPEAVVETAHRELGEETGSKVRGDLIPLGSYFTSAGFTDEHCHLFLATDVVPRDEGHRHDADEAIVECRAFTIGELRAMIASGEICDANTLCLFARMTACGHI